MRFIARRLTVASIMAVFAATALGGCVVAPPAAPVTLAPGQPLPPGYQGDAYAVADWQARGLYAPPPGYRWSYVDGQYVLATVATGIIAAAFLAAMFGHGGPGPGPGFGHR